MINLLPSKEKKQLKQEENWRQVFILSILALVFLVSLSLTLLSVKIYISSHLEAQKSFLTDKEREFQETDLYALKTEVQKINEILLSLEFFYQERINSSDIFQEIWSLLPEGVYLNSFSHEPAASSDGEYVVKVFLSGLALEQKELFEFKENLEKQENFSDIYFPLSSWVEFDNISFSINFKLKR